MQQITFSDIEYKNRKRITKREKFLNCMNEVIPWDEWIAFIKPYYPESGKVGRPPVGIEKMLRMYLLQCWFNLSDEGLEDSIYDSHAFKSFLGIDFNIEQAPDSTTLLKFRHLLEENGIAEKFFHAINDTFKEHGFIMRGGTIVDATIIQAPTSTKNKLHSRDPEMKSTKKGNQYFFGFKTHIGVDAGSGYIHSMEVTAANAHDVTVASKLIRPDDSAVYGDSGYIGIQKREEIKNNEHLSKIEYRINKRYKSARKIPLWYNWDKRIEKMKSITRSKVEHPFLIIKRLFGYMKARYKGLEKNRQRMYILAASANLLMSIRAGRTLPA